MLRQLYIKNFTLIDELDIEFVEGFSVITGETGAGKSIILGAIGLLLGQRADLKTIKQGAERCVIEAHFDLSRYDMQYFFQQNDIDYEASDCIVRRELTATGKSRAFINDTPVPLAVLKELGEQLVDVHSQHQNLLLGKQDFQLEVVDVLAEDASLLETYRQAYSCYQQTARQLDALRQEIEDNRQQSDFLKFQFDELQGAHLQEGEQEELEQRSETMTHAEDIKVSLYQADRALSADSTGIVGQLKTSASALHGIERVFPVTAELAQRMDAAYVELKDLAMEVSGNLERVDFNPAELDAVNQRLDRIYELQKKYHVDSVQQLLDMQQHIGEQLSAIENADEALANLKQQLQEAEDLCRKYAQELSQSRTRVARIIEKDIQQRLMPLGMPHVRFTVDVRQQVLGRNGQDQISFLFSANTSTPLQPVAQVASGGEIARVMLSLKAMISGAVKLPTIIFDEIDTGVSGKIAEQMAQMMHQMAQAGRQVISITHLPQIAAMGDCQYKVYKEETKKGTVSQMKQLSAEERVSEIAQMLSGSDVTEAAIQNAKELLKK